MPRMYFRTFLNPSKLLDWEPGFSAPNQPENPTAQELLNFLCPLDMASDMSAFRRRYREISKMDRDLFLILEEPELKENLFGPLRQAKTNYVIGNYLSSITLCGIVAEKLAILVHAFSTPSKAERRKFESLHQADRINELKQAGHIDEQAVRDYGAIRAARRTYLHHWNIPEERTAKRAVQAYAAATRLVIGVMDVQIINGHVRLNPKLRKYLEDRDQIVIKDDEE